MRSMNSECREKSSQLTKSQLHERKDHSPVWEIILLQTDQIDKALNKRCNKNNSSAITSKVTITYGCPQLEEKIYKVTNF